VRFNENVRLGPPDVVGLEALVGEVALFDDVTVHQGEVKGMAV
jgi:hypothetical protein